MSHGSSRACCSRTARSRASRSALGCARSRGARPCAVARRDAARDRGAVGARRSRSACCRERRVARIGLLGAASVPASRSSSLDQHARDGRVVRLDAARLLRASRDGPPGLLPLRLRRGHRLPRRARRLRPRAPRATATASLAAAGTTLRRLKMHLVDAANARAARAPRPVGASSRAATRARRALASLARRRARSLAYAPFYFDGNYPGGGARFFADVLPLEHVLLAVRSRSLAARRSGAGRARRSRSSASRFTRLRPRAARAIATAAGRCSKPRRLARAGVTRGLVFVDTDHGFDLGFDPARTDAQRRLVVARHRDDAHDAILWERPRSPARVLVRIRAERGARVRPRVVPLALRPRAEPTRIEAEAEWPPLAVESGFVRTSFPACASGHRALAIHPDGPRQARVRLRNPGAESRAGTLRTGMGRGA